MSPAFVTYHFTHTPFFPVSILICIPFVLLHTCLFLLNEQRWRRESQKEGGESRCFVSGKCYQDRVLSTSEALSAGSLGPRLSSER